MKKLALIIALFSLLLTAAISDAANEDKDFRAGLKAYNTKNYSSAVKYFKEYISRKPDPTAYYLAGYALYKLGRFSEADNHFRDAYLIDPEFSLEKVGLIKKSTGEVVSKDAAGAGKAPAVSEMKESKKEPEKTARADTKEAQPARPAQQPTPAPKAAAPERAGQPAPQNAPPSSERPKSSAQTAPQAVPAPPAAPAVPAPLPAPMPKKGMPAAGPAALIGIIAAMGMILVVIVAAVYIYFCLCLFFIAKKLGVPVPWTAWIPIVQLWTFVTSAGKPGWWIILLFIPLVNLFVNIYLWMCITENLGKNKWLGLLILVPFVGFIFPGWLAFSKSETSGSYAPHGEGLSE